MRGLHFFNFVATGGHGRHLVIFLARHQLRVTVIRAYRRLPRTGFFDHLLQRRSFSFFIVLHGSFSRHVINVGLRRSSFGRINTLIEVVAGAVDRVDLGFFVFNVTIGLVGSLVSFGFLSQVFGVFHQGVYLGDRVSFTVHFLLQLSTTFFDRHFIRRFHVGIVPSKFSRTILLFSRRITNATGQGVSRHGFGSETRLHRVFGNFRAFFTILNRGFVQLVRRVYVYRPVQATGSSSRLVRLYRSRPVDVFGRRDISIQGISTYFGSHHHCRGVMFTNGGIHRCFFRLDFQRLSIGVNSSYFQGSHVRYFSGHFGIVGPIIGVGRLPTP